VKQAPETSSTVKMIKRYFLPKFSSAANAQGYVKVEAIEPEVSMAAAMQLPMVLSHRFRKAPATWPCLQVGLGVLTVNQINEGYDWDSFKLAIEQGLQVFNQSDSSRMEKVKDSVKLLLTYQNVVLLDQSEALITFLKREFNLDIVLPTRSAKNDLLGDIDRLSLPFAVKSKAPKGEVVIKISQILADTESAYLIEISIDSYFRELNEYNIAAIMNWTKLAHVIPKHADKTLMNQGT
jgi:uncharacterized protein (TIGR04255 family)